MTGSRPARVLGLLYAAFAVLLGVALLSPDRDTGLLLAVAAFDLVMVAVCFAVPWQRWPVGVTLVLSLPTAALIGICISSGLLPPRSPSVAFTLLFVWVGSYFARWSSLLVLPLAVTSYVVGAQVDASGVPLRLQAVVMLALMWVLVAETIAYQHTRIQTSLEEFTFLVENCTDLIVRLDEHSVIRYVSPSVTTLLGWTPEEMVGRPSAEFRHPDDTGSVGPSLARPDDAVLTTRRLRHRDGGYRRVETLSRTLRTPHGHEVLSTSRDVTERYEAERELERRATHDPLTDLPNRDLFGRRLNELLRPPVQGPRSRCALVFLDLDGFKAVNDAHGHAVGDELLREVASRLSALVRPGDTVARFGGDEFVLLLTDLPESPDALQRVVARIELAVTAPYFLSCGAASVGCSVGIVPVDGDLTALELLARADHAMYERKRRGPGDRP